jgi:hypothetical protein
VDEKDDETDRLAVVLPVFQKCMFCLEFSPQYKFKEKQALKQEIIQRGGTISHIITKKVGGTNIIRIILHVFDMN